MHFSLFTRNWEGITIRHSGKIDNNKIDESEKMYRKNVSEFVDISRADFQHGFFIKLILLFFI